jgi:uncharacterized protein YjbJ (UPF0337 family)
VISETIQFLPENLIFNQHIEPECVLHCTRSTAKQQIDFVKHEGGSNMGLPNKDEVEGKLDQAKGKVKETVGRAIDDRDLEQEGKADHASGKVQEGFGTARRKVGEAIEDVGDAIKR